MADLLGEVDANILPARNYEKKAIKSEARRKVRVLSPPLTQTRKQQVSLPRHIPKIEKRGDTPLVKDAFSDDDDGVLNPVGEDDALMSDPLPSSPTARVAERKREIH